MPTKRFVRRGVSKFKFIPTLAAPAAVTRANLTAATELSPNIADVNGWMLENQSAATPDMGSSFDSSVPGNDQANDSSLTFYEDLDDATIETLLPKGTSGYMIILRKGDVPNKAKSMDVFAVRCGSKSPEYSAGNDPARFVNNFTITEAPWLDQTVPA